MARGLEVESVEYFKISKVMLGAFLKRTVQGHLLENRFSMRDSAIVAIEH